jgi:hypothetical protein
MKLPFTNRDHSIQANFDKLAAAVRTPVLASMGVGGWSTVNWPGGTAGTVFVPTTTPAFIMCWATGFNTAGLGGLAVEVQVDGVLRATMELVASTAINEHLMMSPAVFTVPLALNVPHYIWFKQTVGTSNFGDRSGMVVFA